MTFLSKMSCLFSSYYNRVRVLAVCVTIIIDIHVLCCLHVQIADLDTLELMWARYYMIKALRTVFATCLNLLDIPLLSHV